MGGGAAGVRVGGGDGMGLRKNGNLFVVDSIIFLLRMNLIVLEHRQ